MKSPWNLLALFSISLIYGCTTTVFQSKEQLVKKSIEVEEDGYGAMGYYLPKGLIRVQIKPKENPPATGTSTPAPTQGTTTPPAGDAGQPKEKRKGERVTGGTSSSSGGNGQKQGKGGPSPEELELIVSTVYVPDPKCFYLLKYLPNPAADQTVSVSLNQQGLLQSVNVTTEDKTPEIIVKITEIAKEIIKLPVLGVPSVPSDLMKRLELPEFKPKFIRKTDAVFNPQDLIAKEEQVYAFPKITIALKPHDPNQQSSSDEPLKPSVREGIDIQKVQKGVYYRAPLPYVLTITMEGSQIIKDNPVDISYIKDVVAYLPNFSPILFMDITGAAFVRKVNNLSFDNGILTSFSITKPSQILAGLNIPLDILKSVATLPTELIQLKIDYSTAKTSLIQQKTAEIEAKQKLVEALQKERDQLKKEQETKQ